MAGTPRRSIERTLPLLMCGLLLAVVGTLSWTAYGELKDALLTGVGDRLDGTNKLLSDLLVQTTSTRQRAIETLARRGEVASYLAAPTPETRDAAVAALAPASRTGGAVAIEVWDAAGRCVLSVARSDAGAPAAAGGTPGAAPTTPPPPPVVSESGEGCLGAPERDSRTTGVGALRRSDSRVIYEVSAPVRAAGDSASTPVGTLVSVMQVTGGGGEALIEGLIGSSSRLLIGSTSGDAWATLQGAAEGPPVDSATVGVVEYTDENGVDRVGSAQVLTGVPWIVWVDFPRDAILAPLNRFLQARALIAFLFLLLGAVGAWTVGHRIALPLRDLTRAAEAIATGASSQRVHGSANDETGRLALAFNLMAEQVDQHNRELEQRVAERTKELESTLAQLEEAQEQLVRREKLAMLGQLASGVGHELRNPLGVMANAVYYLEMVLENPRRDITEYLEILRNQIGLSEKIVSDLLDFARIKPPQRERFSMEALIDEQLSRLSQPEGVRVAREVAPELTITGDRVQVGQVVLNLVSNAYQAMEDRGGVLTLRGTGNGATVRLDVTDTGSGIAAENMTKIFEPLFTTKARGIGLGLAVARSLAEANGGSLTVTSPPGVGATFSLTLPTPAASPEASA